MARTFSNMSVPDLLIIRKALKILYKLSDSKQQSSLIENPEQWAELILEISMMQSRVIDLLAAITDELNDHEIDV